MQRSEIAEQFEAIDDDGHVHTIVRIQHYTAFTPLGGAVEWRPGSYEFELADGRDVTVKDAKTFEITDTGQLIRKIEEI